MAEISEIKKTVNLIKRIVDSLDDEITQRTLGTLFAILDEQLDDVENDLYDAPLHRTVVDDEDEYDEYDEDDEPHVVNGFENREQYEKFLNEQDDFVPKIPVFDEETGEATEIKVEPDDVAGVVQQEDGSFTEIGNFEESLDTATEMLVEKNTIRDGETGQVLVENEIQDVNTIRVRIHRADGEKFTDANVRTLLEHPQSQPMLNTFGKDYTVEHDDTDSATVFLVFNIDQNNTTASRVSKILADGQLMTFGGKIVVPTIGIVSSNIVF